MEAIQTLENLTKGWDGYEADRPATIAINHARLFASLIKNQEFKVKPSVVGGIGITICNEEKKCYIEFGNCGSIYILFKDSGDLEPMIHSINASIRDFKNTINEIQEFLKGNK